jgi:hypothetical protein
VEDATVLGILANCPLRFETVRVLLIRRDDRVYEFANPS